MGARVALQHGGQCRDARGLRARALTALPVVLLPLAAAACGGGGPGGASGSQHHTSTSVPAAASSKALPLAIVCADLKTTLAAGPNPHRNPVGYAKAQLVPLTEVRTSDQRLLTALRDLVTADRALVSSKGKDATATAQIASANRSLDVICPGVVR